MSSSRESSPMTLSVVSTVRTQGATSQLRSKPMLRKEANSFDFSSGKQAAFAAERSKSADDASSVIPEDKLDDMVHGSSEFMLVLYPEHEDEPKQKSDSKEKANIGERGMFSDLIFVYFYIWNIKKRYNTFFLQKKGSLQWTIKTWWRHLCHFPFRNSSARVTKS